ncbi:hypothetical protein [Streptomyces sp. NPDC008150]|uniref:hypothetical protein n=1 Tax=Streptomyces sp. NPDC008150 TaxID=3364816 RepID=UPI0036E10902
MSDAVFGLVAAGVGVLGTLISPVFAQRTNARTQQAEFERQQQAVRAQWERERHEQGLLVRRACYSETNAAFRRYRTQQMDYLWHVHRNEVNDIARDALEDARHAHHAAFAQAQMVASPAVLAQLDDVAKALSEGYRRTKHLEEGTPDTGDSFEVIEAYLQWIWERWEEMRAVMREDLGEENLPPSRPSSGVQ